MKTLNLEPMLKPKSVAIIGVSKDPEKVGHVILENYVNAGYDGSLYAINKNAEPNETILGVRTFKRISEIKERIDLAVIAVPAPIVPTVMEECGKAKVRTVVVVSGGFAEIGEVELQDKLASIARKYNMPTLGPNCLGVMDPRSRIDTLFLPTYKLSRPQVGNVSFVSQSGAVGSTILDLISGEGFGLSKFISYGNAAHIDEVDILNYLMEDEETKVIVMYIEGVKRGKEFIEVAKKITKKKPVIVLKAGRTSEGMAAAHSHTAALAGNYEAYEAVFRQFGFVISEDISELLYYAKIFSTEPAPRGNKIAIITNGGGTGVLTTDAISVSKSLVLGEFSKETQKGLEKTMPKLVNIRNPLDLAGDADYNRYSVALDLISKDPNIDMIIVIALFQTPGADSKTAAALIHFKQSSGKPTVVLSIGASYTAMHKIMMESSGLPVYDSPKAIASSLLKLREYYLYKNEGD